MEHNRSMNKVILDTEQIILHLTKTQAELLEQLLSLSTAKAGRLKDELGCVREGLTEALKNGKTKTDL